LHGGNLRGDLLRCFAGLHRERFHFRCHDGKAPSCFTGARRFDGGIERQQIYLTGHILNELDHVTDLLCGTRKRADLCVACTRLSGSNLDQLATLPELPADLVDRGGELVCGRCRALDIDGEASFDMCTAPSARCEARSEQASRAEAVERIARALSLTVFSISSMRERNASMAASNVFGRRRCSSRSRSEQPGRAISGLSPYISMRAR
jgi:hypothetical protein